MAPDPTQIIGAFAPSISFASSAIFSLSGCGTGASGNGSCGVTSATAGN